ncbi:MAG: hypothetical protein EPN21_20760 [Methylococcaceae bacterium]|nr:MAG: hypothetical protein EPN21_20760 [Methylococcaceae bacterium]
MGSAAAHRYLAGKIIASNRPHPKVTVSETNQKSLQGKCNASNRVPPTSPSKHGCCPLQSCSFRLFECRFLFFSGFFSFGGGGLANQLPATSTFEWGTSMKRFNITRTDDKGQIFYSHAYDGKDAISALKRCIRIDDPQCKGRALSQAAKDWLPYITIEDITVYKHETVVHRGEFDGKQSSIFGGL